MLLAALGQWQDLIRRPLFHNGGPTGKKSGWLAVLAFLSQILWIVSMYAQYTIWNKLFHHPSQEIKSPKRGYKTFLRSL